MLAAHNRQKAAQAGMQLIYAGSYQESALERHEEAMPEEVRQWVQSNALHAFTGSMSIQGNRYYLVSRGEKPTGGYGLRLDDIITSQEEELIQVTEIDPTESDPVTQALTYPILLLKKEL